MDMDTQKNALTVPIAIVVAGIIIGGAIFFTRGGPTTEVFKEKPVQTAPNVTKDISSRPVDANDHILGNPNPTVMMLEYSDLECPFCKTFHKTMQTLMDLYAKDGKIAWAYRHFPLDIHPLSPKESEATECAYELAGNNGFWNYLDKVFEITPSNNQLNPAKLSEVANGNGLDLTKFNTCLTSGKYAQKIKDDYADGLKAGVNGTPHTVLILKTDLTPAMEKRLTEINQTILAQLPAGTQNMVSIDTSKRKVGIGGAFPYAMMKEIVDLLLAGK
jgi:protein-disulfide isomerase